jgi:hypothetical protein
MKAAEKTKALVKAAEKAKISKEKRELKKALDERGKVFAKVKRTIRNTFKKYWLPAINKAAINGDDYCLLSLNDDNKAELEANILYGLEILIKEGYKAEHVYFEDDGQEWHCWRNLGDFIKISFK